MFAGNAKDLVEIKVSAPGAVNAFKKSLIGPREGWEGWVMRLFTLKDRGCSPRHAHPWPHINYIVSGQGVLSAAGKETALEEGAVAYVPSNVEHQFRSTADNDFVFICIVPEEGDK
ncbi:MAG: cupin domain-containing protein [Desulfotomaculaceae bacterium]|nr:cupin domain-containing protein [Desulfotomaculaceae bacterium]MDD4767169.1 cupin domain-containing protein [Desulfotomaculaceae bacterium]